MSIERREYQTRIVDAAVKAFSVGGKNVLIESPAGSGKTIMAYLTMQAIKEQAAALLQKEHVLFGWVAMRRNLLAQAKEQNERFFGIPDVHYISMFDANPPKVDVLVIDEAQHDAANSARHVFAQSNPSLALGLSATPYRADRMQLCFDKVIKDAGYHRLIQDGWLSPFDQFILDEYNVDKVVKIYLAEPHRWGRSIMFFDRIAHCHEAAGALRAAGIRCEVVTGQSDRERQLDMFEAGEIDVLLNVYVLTEGFDCPELRTVFVRDSSRGPTIQMAGRALRKHASKDAAIIVQSRDTSWPFVKTARPRRQYSYIDNNWLAVGSNERIESIRKNMLARVTANPVQLPKYLLEKTSLGLNNAQVNFARSSFTNNEDIHA